MNSRSAVAVEEAMKGPLTGLIRSSLERVDSIIFAYLFGSQATGKARPSSDIDVAVFLKEGSDPVEEKLSVIGRLMEGLQTDAVDVVILNTASISLVGRILGEREVVIDRDPFRRHLFESLALRKYMDFSIKETANLERRYRLGR
ncbi:MAG: nucleotidyltransferase domain-containing protein [Syntrophales bacterium]